MSQCGSGYTQHCLWGPDDGRSVCCGHGGEYDFPDLFEFLATDTKPHHCCFLGIQNEPQVCTGTDVGTEAADGRVCGWGCTNCDDLASGAVDSSKLAHQGERLGGRRWLAPVRGGGRRPWDARGLIHDLRSDEYHPIPGRIVYRRGTCWRNDGLECFGADACACFGANTVSPDPGDQDNCDGTPLGDELPDLLPDLFFRTGYRWPPYSPNLPRNPMQDIEWWYCRKFGDTRSSWAPPYEGNVHSMVVVDPSGSGGLIGVTEPMMDPALLSSNVCQSDRLADCTGMYYSPPYESPCYWHSAFGACIQALIEPTPDGIDQCKRTYYYASAARDRFAKLDISGDNTAHIVVGEDDHSRLAGATAAWKNDVLDAVRTQQFPLVSEAGEVKQYINFDRLDHQAEIEQNNSGIGIFQREWFGMPKMVEVANGSGVGRLRQAGCLFEYRTWITRVKIVCRLILQQYHGEGAKYINPLVRLHIIATTTISVDHLHLPEILGKRRVEMPCSFTSSRDGQPVYLEVHNERTDTGYIPRLYGSRTAPREWPTPPGELRAPRGDPTDYGESFMFFDADGRQFIPSPFVEWRGFLGGHSNPTSEEQKITLFADSFGSCELVADRFNYHPDHGQGITVPGWPTHVDSNPADPAGIYGGHVRLEFL